MADGSDKKLSAISYYAVRQLTITNHLQRSAGIDSFLQKKALKT